MEEGKNKGVIIIMINHKTSVEEESEVIEAVENSERWWDK